MHYAAIAEHLAKQCRKALGAAAIVPRDGGLWVGRPQKNTDRLRMGDSYSFGIGETDANVVGDLARFKWRAYVIVYKNHVIAVKEEVGHVPSHVAECMLAGRV